jgi:cytochrome c-type biogenesis protein CcmH
VPVLVIAAAIVAVAVLLAARGGSRAATAEDRARAIASGLRCPVCQNLSVADSPSRLAGEMRAEIEDRVRAGQSDEEVRAFFVERYGEWVLLAPTRRGLNLLPWAFPVVAVVLGVAVWVFAVRRAPAPTPTVVSEAERRRIGRELEALEDER